MADVVTYQTLFSGTEKKVFKFTNLCDGTGEDKVLKIDVDGTNTDSAPLGCNWPAGTTFKITQLWIVGSLAFQLYWNATSDIMLFAAGGSYCEHFDFRSFGGITNNAGAGVDGNLELSTVGNTATTAYTIIMEIVKD